ncbi:MAG TPA: TIGR02186 family protein [Stellaceae bacterium]|jgi:uncharacterized protein (TIGR02186 family)
MTGLRRRSLLGCLRCAAAALVILAAAGGLSAPAHAEAPPLVADLTSHLVGITTAFNGTSVVLFGATDGPGDIVVVVRGPERDIVVRRKSRVLGIWVNTREVTFAGVPGFYSVASSRPIEEIASPAMRTLHQIGLDSLRIAAQSPANPERAAIFREALIRTQKHEKLFVDAVGKVNFLGERLFRTTIALPANVPTGTYLVQVFLVRENEVVSGQTTPLVISKIGIDADLYDFADRKAALYGLVAVATAMVAGWLASLPFRSA